MSNLAPSTASDALNSIRLALDRAYELTLRQERRESDANDRLADVQKLLWMWAAGEFPSVHKFEISGGHEAEVLAEAERTKMIVDRVNASRIHELATVLGVDLHPAIVANEMQKRADAERAATEVLCVCNHGRALHAENGVGRCRGYHRNYTCDRYIANAIAQGSSAT